MHARTRTHAHTHTHTHIHTHMHTYTHTHTGDGMLTQGELSFAVRSGVMRCWDLWFGCMVGMSFFAYIKRLLAVAYL